MDSRARLIQAMSDLMWERGYAAATPREVRERAGVGQGSMYHHFAGKRELAIAALDCTCTDLLPSSEALLQGAGSPTERLSAYLGRPREALRGCKVGRMTQDPVVATDPGLLAPIHDSFATLHAALAQVVAEAIEMGELPDDLNPQRIARLMAATVQGGYVLSIAAQDRSAFDDACAGALDLLRAAARKTPRATDLAAHSRKEQK